ncbi:unnamed protein product [Rotaria sp. Silwood1]|nr:unnamed protein product [Rotaria sp. Silwood1]CAF4865913.1 unnamed protein product [Rotaria sp. Silwood1]
MITLDRIYRITIITSDKLVTGINDNLYIIIYGEYNNNTDRIQLVRSKTNKDRFEKSQKNLFEIETIDIGQPKKIKISHDHSDFSLDWLLEDVEIEIPNLGHKWIFQCDKSINKRKSDYKFEIDLYPKQMSIEVSRSFYTSNTSGAGTDANVFIQIYGINKSTDQIILSNQIDRYRIFKIGSIDTFLIELDGLGDNIEKIRIGHDNQGFDPSWHLDRVEIRRLIKG